MWHLLYAEGLKGRHQEGARPSDLSVIYLLFKDFIKPVLLAIAIALPVGYVLSKNWLAAYAYQTEIVAWYLLLAGSGTFLLSVIAVFFQARKAAGLNPAQIIRMRPD